jgi:uncharacterized protein YndB with AHSA1/START domain
MTKRRITLERTYDAPLDDVWELWTTPAGIEAWWGPDGFEVKVLEMDLRPGGQMNYAMTATAAPQIGFMKRAGMPLTTKTKVTFDEVTPKRRLTFTTHADFIPGVAPYPVATQVELEPTAKGVKVVLTLDAMHDQVWTERAVAGWENELGKLGKALEARR